MQPLWSPNSRQLLITVQRQNNFDTVLCVFQLEDETLDCRTNGAVRDSQGAWSPDGRQIAFVSFTSRQVMVSGMGGTSTALLQIPHIYLMDADGNGLQQLTLGEQGFYAPAWRP
jgi:Tol biopolymer transport system component